MKVIVHRGTHEIGGSCIELSCGGTRLLFDAGLPLEMPDDGQADLPETVRRSAAEFSAVFLSHAHGDHAGLISRLPASVPVWMTAGTSKMLLAGSLFARQQGVDRGRIRLMREAEAVRIGPFGITPLPLDHSIFGAVGFLIEAGGRRVVYTGDLRMHGRKPGMTRRFIAFVKAHGPVDALLIEGTRIGDRASEPNVSEHEVSVEMARDIADAPGAVLVSYSPLNLDRFVSVFKSRGRRTMVIDPYQAFVLHLIGSPRLPDPLRHPDFVVMAAPSFPFGRAARCLRKKPWFGELRRRLVSPVWITNEPERFVVLYRDSMREWLFPEGPPAGSTCIFSYWPGYLREERIRRMQAEIESRGGRLVVRHASGHAHPEDLRKFADEIDAGMLVPVHTTKPALWHDLRERAVVMGDGRELLLN